MIVSKSLSSLLDGVPPLIHIHPSLGVGVVGPPPILFLSESVLYDSRGWSGVHSQDPPQPWVGDRSERGEERVIKHRKWYLTGFGRSFITFWGTEGGRKRPSNKSTYREFLVPDVKTGHPTNHEVTPLDLSLISAT